MTSRIGYFALFSHCTNVVFHFHFCARFDKEFEQSNAETMTRRNRGLPPIFYPLVFLLSTTPLFRPSPRHKSIPEMLSCQLVFLDRPARTLVRRRKDILRTRISILRLIKEYNVHSQSLSANVALNEIRR